MENLAEAYRILNNVINKGAYSNVEMKTLAQDCDRAFVTRLVYGVIENDIMLDYYIEQLSNKRPKPNISLILKIGLYILLKMSVPEYAAINNIVQLTKKIGKQGVSGYVNAVLRKWRDVKLPDGDGLYALSLRYSYPKWVVEKLVKQYSLEFAKDFLSYEFINLTHIRHNGNRITKEDFEELIYRLDERKEVQNTIYGYYVTHNILDVLHGDYSDLFTAQSLASLLVCNAFEKKSGIDVLDVCAAPGGKSIYLAESLQANVVACDIYPHRVELIKSYTSRMKNNSVSAMLYDGTRFNKEFAERFDAVLCDVPCSGFGVVSTKPDIKLNKEKNDIGVLSDLQFKILSNASGYVKPGGELIYSTCTVFNEENIFVVQKFLNEEKDFKLSEIQLPVMPKRRFPDMPEALQYLPNLDNVSGYFIAKLKRNK